MSKNIINFGAGPAKLPKEVLEEVQHELLSYQSTGISVLELSHRSSEFMQINNNAKQAVRQLLNVPGNYEILFMHGGGNGQFAAIPLNLLNDDKKADYAVTGYWSKKAAHEAGKFGVVNNVCLNTASESHYNSIPAFSTWKLNPDSSYLYYCDNETIDGLEYDFVPGSLTHNATLVSDMSSNIMTKEIDVSKVSFVFNLNVNLEEYGLIFAGAQKNIGPAGVTIVIVRKDLIGQRKCGACPSIFDYQSVAENNSLLNTPSTFSLYVTNRVFEWIKKQGGVAEMEKQAKVKSDLLYKTIRDSNGFYTCPVRSNRSRMNVPFRIRNGAEAETTFLQMAEQEHGMVQLKGHRSKGGLRASLYNAVTLDDVRTLVDFMDEFRSKFDS